MLPNFFKMFSEVAFKSASNAVVATCGGISLGRYETLLAKFYLILQSSNKTKQGINVNSPIKYARVLPTEPKYYDAQSSFRHCLLTTVWRVHPIPKSTGGGGRGGREREMKLANFHVRISHHII